MFRPLICTHIIQGVGIIRLRNKEKNKNSYNFCSNNIKRTRWCLDDDSVKFLALRKLQPLYRKHEALIIESNNILPLGKPHFLNNVCWNRGTRAVYSYYEMVKYFRLKINLRNFLLHYCCKSLVLFPNPLSFLYFLVETQNLSRNGYSSLLPSNYAFFPWLETSLVFSNIKKK